MKTDEELIQLCLERDGHAWEALVRVHQTRILNLAYQFTGNEQEAQDLAQEIFVRLYESLDLYQKGRPFRTWFNGEKVLESRTCQRSWPAAFPAEVELAKGQNDVLVRIDLMTDQLALEIGFKEHHGQHSYQSQWDTTLVPMI